MNVETRNLLSFVELLSTAPGKAFELSIDHQAKFAREKLRLETQELKGFSAAAPFVATALCVSWFGLSWVIALVVGLIAAAIIGYTFWVVGNEEKTLRLNCYARDWLKSIADNSELRAEWESLSKAHPAKVIPLHNHPVRRAHLEALRYYARAA